MVDNRTVIYGIDSNPGGLFMYVAEKKRRNYQQGHFMPLNAYKPVRKMAVQPILNGSSLAMRLIKKYRSLLTKPNSVIFLTQQMMR
jgi:hypothetical protein